MAGNFDLAAAISGIVSTSDTNAPEVRMIPIADIIPNPKNFYKVDMEALKPLMDSIAMDGLHHYPLVMTHPKQEGKWQLIDGERRYTACRELAKEDEKFSVIPCTVKEYGSTALAELQLILSNSTNRVLSPAEISRQAEETEMLFYQLKEEGYEFPGRMRDLVAAACNVSATKLARLKVIREKLHADYQYLFEKNKLPEQTAYALARLPEEFQERIVKIMGSNVPSGDAAEKILKLYEDGWRWDAAELKCPDGQTCGGGDRFLRHDLTAQSWEVKCGGNKCCLNCGSYCDRMCSKAKAARKEKKAELEAKSTAASLERAKPHQLKTMENANRLLKAIDAARLSDTSSVPWSSWGDGSRLSVENIRKMADADFEGMPILYRPLLEPEQLEKPLEACKVLKCSADYLLGLTEELHGGGEPELKWKSPEEKPVVGHEVVGKFTMEGLLKPKVMITHWNGIRWCFPSGAGIEAECIGWWPVPEEVQDK